MKLEDQVCSLELAKRLKELGVKQESLFYSDAYGVHDHNPDPLHDSLRSKCLSRFTVAELGEMLPPFVTTEKYLCKLKPRFNAHEEKSIEQHCWHDDKEADARTKMLIYLIENKLLPETPTKSRGGDEMNIPKGTKMFEPEVPWIRFKGEEFILVDGAITTPELYNEFIAGYAHLFDDGVIKRYGEIIGTKEDIQFVPKAQEDQGR